MSTDLEVWKNGVASTHVLKRRFGDGWKDEVVKGFATIRLTEGERVFNQSRVNDAKHDPFRNGRFEPVQLIEDAEGVDAIKDSPNVISGADIDRLVNEVEADQLLEKLGEFDSAVVVRRLFNAAVDAGATRSRVEMIEARLIELDPTVRPKPKKSTKIEGDGSFVPEPPQLDLAPAPVMGVTDLESI